MPAEYGTALSEREREIVELVAEGLANKEIGARLHLSPNTIKVHLRNIFAKTGANSRTELTMTAIREGWVTVTTLDGNKIGEELAEGADWEPAAGETLAEEIAIPVAEAVMERIDSAGGVEAAIFESVAVESGSVPVVVPLVPESAWPNRRWMALLLGGVLALIVMVFPGGIAGAGGSGGSNALVDSPDGRAVSSVGDAREDWSELAALPIRRGRLGTAYLNKRVYAVGGVTADGLTGRLDIYDTETNRWSEGAPRPVALGNVGAVVVDDQILVPGGCDLYGIPSTAVHLYDPESDQWKSVASLPQPLCGYALAVHDDQVYLFGGWDGDRNQATAYRYDFATDRWSELSPSQEARQLGAAAALGKKIYYVGGSDARGERDSCEVYTPDTDQWGSCPGLLQARAGLGLVAVGGRIYAVGGGWTNYLGFSEQFDPVYQSWTPLESPLVGEWRNLGLTASETSIYAVGGWNGDYLNRTYRLDLLPFRIFISVPVP